MSFLQFQQQGRRFTITNKQEPQRVLVYSGDALSLQPFISGVAPINHQVCTFTLELANCKRLLRGLGGFVGHVL